MIAIKAPELFLPVHIDLGFSFDELCDRAQTPHGFRTYGMFNPAGISRSSLMVQPQDLLQEVAQDLMNKEIAGPGCRTAYLSIRS